jgi:phosphatidylglycerol:prolipoprotein diacylglycerol transferase
MGHDFLHLPPPGHYFTLFYTVAFVVALGILLWEGYRRKFPMLPWILMVLFSQILFIAGTKLFTLSGDEWRSIFSTLSLVPAPKKELFGGVLFLVAGLLIGKRWMKFRTPFADAFALAIPSALVFQKAGCFFAGCCSGTPSSLPWAVQYPVYTLPHFFHHQQALIGQSELFSLPVHPVQLYELLGALLVVALVIAFQKRWKQPGSSVLFSLSLYLAVRFGVEFFKDTAGHTTGGAMVGIFNQTQWSILLLLPLFLLLLVRREIRSTPVLSLRGNDSPPSLPAVVSFFALSGGLIVVFRNWFHPVELGVILLFFMVAALHALLLLFRTCHSFRVRLAYAVLLLLPFLLMGQTLPQQLSDSVVIRKSKSVGVGISTGNYNNSLERYSGEGCDRISNTAYFNQKYLIGGASLNFKEENLTRARTLNYGLDLILGQHTEALIKTGKYPPDSVSVNTLLPDPERKFLFSISPYLSYDERWYGIGGGIHAGQLSYTVYNKEVEGDGMPVSGRKMVRVYPRLYLRFGPRDIAFADYHLASHFPSALPGYRQMVGLGTGLGKNDGTLLRLGTIIGDKYNSDDWDFLETQMSGVYVTGNFPLKSGLTIEPLLLFTTSEADSKIDFQFSVGMRYELGMREFSRAASPK